MTYKIKIPKIMFLALDIARFYRRVYFNTNDLAELANKYKKDLVRQRADKTDYKYLDDTKHGGLRGNFSTLVTWKGFVKRGSTIVNRCSIGKDGRLVNAICKGEIILNKEDLTAHTTNKKLKRLLELETWLLNIREGQAHIKVMLERNKKIQLKRDNDNFPKVSVVKTSREQYFIRAIVNNFADNKNSILEYNISDLWEGTKLKKKNLHVLIVIPSKKNPWDKIYAVRNEDLFKHKPILIYVDLRKNICFDKHDNGYKLYTLEEALNEFSNGEANIEKRLEHRWEDIKLRECDIEVDSHKTKKDEFNIFLDKFLEWKKIFYIDGKKVVDIKVSSSGGPDVILIYSGGTTQKLELEHSWQDYIVHKHHEDNAWSGSWLFADEEWDGDKILNLFKALKPVHNERIPDVFLCVYRKQRKAYRVNWGSGVFEEIDLKF
ncbi:MAG: hypothetical protein Q8R31_04895 [Candidatus Omnitrophota bacterium]|nr:hypothetical protein [Candidatus Omnitrophota bacterium]